MHHNNDNENNASSPNNKHNTETNNSKQNIPISSSNSQDFHKSNNGAPNEIYLKNTNNLHHTNSNNNFNHIANASILPNESNSHTQKSTNNTPEIITPTNPIIITHENNTAHRKGNKKDSIHSAKRNEDNETHPTNSANLSIDNESIFQDNPRFYSGKMKKNKESKFKNNDHNMHQNLNSNQFHTRDNNAIHDAHDLNSDNNKTRTHEIRDSISDANENSLNKIKHNNNNKDTPKIHKEVYSKHTNNNNESPNSDNSIHGDDDNDDEVDTEDDPNRRNSNNSNDEGDILTINIEKNSPENRYSNLRDLDRGKELLILSGMTPLKTVLYLSIGPLLNQITSAIEGFVQTIWVSKAIGNEGMSAISSYMPFENITRAFGLTTACAGSNSISAIIATNKADKEESSQVIADLLRVCLVIGIIIPVVLCPLVKKAVKWFGASDTIVNIGYNYILPILIGTFFTCMYLGINGFLEGEGRPILYSIITIVTTIANIGFLCPLFLLGFNMNLLGVGLSQIISHAVTGSVLFVLYFTGAFTVKPKFSQLFKKFSPLTGSALKACLSQGIANLALSIPAILIRKLLGKMSISESAYTDSVTGFHAVTRYTQIVDKIIIAFVTGYLPAASFAYTTKDYKRWLFLTLHVNWLCFAWGSFTSILTFSIPTQLAKAFLDQESYVSIAKTMIQIANSGGFFAFAEYTVGNMLRSLKMGFMAAVMGTLVHLVSVFGFALILYHAYKTRPERLMYAYPLSNLFGMVVAGIFIAYPAYKFKKEWKFYEENEEDNKGDISASSNPLPRIEVANVDSMI